MTYSKRNISSRKSLCLALGITEVELSNILQNKENFYHEMVLSKGSKERIVYRISEPLKFILTKIAKHILSYAYYPDYLYAGIKGRSYIEAAKIHLQSKIIISEDISNFFPSITERRVKKIFQYYLCFSEEVSHLLASLCCYRETVIQGSPVSGFLANLVFFDKEPEVVQFFIKKNYRYTRYYDDIVVSSSVDINKNDISIIKDVIYGMLIGLGFRPNRDKSKIERAYEQQTVHNIVVNSLKISPTKTSISQIRIRLDKFKKHIFQFSGKIAELDHILQEYYSIVGTLNSLKQSGARNIDKYFKQAFEVLQDIDHSFYKKYIRLIRKVKTKKQFLAYRSKLSVISKLDPSLKNIVDIEAGLKRKKMWR